MDKILIAGICDRSGSMYTILADAIGGFDTMINKQKEVKDKTINLTLATFDTAYDLKTKNLPIDKFTTLKDYDYVPRGGTALFDAIGRTINAVEKDSKDYNKIIVVIQTDGEENSSVEYSVKDIKLLIDKYKEEGWEFIFLGAGLKEDVEYVTRSIGIDTINTVSYDRTGEGMSNAYYTTSCTIDSMINNEDLKSTGKGE